MAEKKRGRPSKSSKSVKSSLGDKLKNKKTAKKTVSKKPTKVTKKISNKSKLKVKSEVEPVEVKETVTSEPIKNIEPEIEVEMDNTESKAEEVNSFVESAIQEESTSNESVEKINDPVIDAASSKKGGAWSPFSENVEAKSYRTPPVVNAQIPDISEPMFSPPTYDDIIREENPQPEAPTQEDIGGSPFSNESLAGASASEQKGGAEHLAKTVMGVYRGLNGFLINKTKVSERDMMKKSEEYGFPLNQTVPIDATSRVSYVDVIESYNQQVEESLEYSEDFHNEAEPLMTQIFEERNIGMSAEQRLGFLFIQDIGMKVYMMREMKNRVSDLTEHFASVSQKEAGGRVKMAARPSEPDTRQERPSPPPPSPSPEEPSMANPIPQEELSEEENTNEKVLKGSVVKHKNLEVNRDDLKVLDVE